MRIAVAEPIIGYASMGTSHGLDDTPQPTDQGSVLVDGAFVSAQKVTAQRVGIVAWNRFATVLEPGRFCPGAVHGSTTCLAQPLAGEAGHFGVDPIDLSIPSVRHHRVGKFRHSRTVLEISDSLARAATTAS